MDPACVLGRTTEEAIMACAGWGLSIGDLKIGMMTHMIVMRRKKTKYECGVKNATLIV